MTCRLLYTVPFGRPRAESAQSDAMGKIARRFDKGPPPDRLGPVRVRAWRVPTLTAGSEGGAVRVGGSGSHVDPEASGPGRRRRVTFLKARWIAVLPAGVCDVTAVRRHLRPPASLSSP